MRFHSSLIPAVLLSVLLADKADRAEGADWPQYRGDAMRSGYTEERLPEKMQLAWHRRARHRPQPAWVGREGRDLSRMRFDHAYHVVVADGTCYFGGSVDGKVYALDAATGEQRWTFYTDGPVRFAPVVYKERLFAVSDDGYLYCLAMQDGSLHWKLRGGPSDDRVIGNGRIVSRWPARGGPVLKDGVVYFACGIWPTEGVYIYAVDADSGRTLWVNDSSGALEIGQPHQVCFSRSGVAAQGFMVATNESLLVATGRAVPACLDRATGKLRYFHLQRYGSKSPAKLGDADVVATESVFFNTGYVFDLDTGKGYSRVMPWRHWGSTPDGHRVRTTVEQFAVTPGDILHTSQTELFGGELSWKEGTVREFNLAEVLPLPSVDNRWSTKLDAEIVSLIAAGDKIVVGLLRHVVILDATTRDVISSHPVDGLPHGLAAADDALFVSTDTGSIYCLRGGQPISPQRIAPSLTPSPHDGNELSARAAKEIVKTAGVTEGYCLDLGCGGGALAYELATRTSLRIIAVAEDAGDVAAVRAKLDSAGLYGSRVTVLHADPTDTMLPQYFANLIVSGRSVTAGLSGFSDAEAQRVQRPYGGTICVGAPGSMRTSVRGPLEGAGQWTHHFASAARTLNSNDRLITGRQQSAVHPMTGQQELWEIKGKTFGCGPVTGCPSALFNRSGTLTYTDLDSYQGKLEHYGGIRPGCWVATLPVGGLVLMPDDTSLCNCSYLNRASVALAHYGERPPAIHPDGAIFTDSVTVTITSFNAEHEIRYTTDGSEPTAQSPRYTHPFELRQTSVIKVATFSDGAKIATLDARRFAKTPPIPPMPDVHLGDLEPVTAVGGKFHKNQKFFGENAVGIDNQFDGRPLNLAGETFQKGLSALTFSEFTYDLMPDYQRFVARVGTGTAGGKLVGGQPTYDNVVLPRPAIVTVLVDGKLIHRSPRLNPGEPPWNIDIQLPAGAKQITLYATFDQSGGKEHWETTATVVNWANTGFVKRQ